jgi:hypothetical protein
MPAIVVKEEPRLRPGRSSREATPTASKANTTLATPPTMAETATTDLTMVFKSDLTNIRNLVTCSICDQLLYEPWTLGCGHTYCYSCLCNWFVPNRRKKTCPECRTKVKQMPAPNFLVKQMVEIFTKRVELMPADESIDQHSQRRAEEIAAVDDDKNNPDGGLFKGTFPKRSGELWRDEADGVLRCPECGHEHEGGPECQVCGFEIDDDSYPYSDMTDDDADLEDLDDLELDLEVDSEFADIRADHHHHHHHFVGVDLAHLQHPHAQHFFHHHLHNHPPPRNARDNWTNSDGVTTSDGSAMGSDSEDGGSLQEFVVQDDDEPIRPPGRAPVRHTQRQTINLLSDDESDEGGAVSNRRPPRRNWRLGTVTPSAPSVLTVTDDSTNGSEAGDLNNEAAILRAGWSPLDQDHESDTDGLVEHEYGYGHGLTTEDEQDSDGQSDTETMVGNGVDYEDDNRSRDSLSETPTYDGPGQYRDLNPYGPPPYINLTEDDDEGSETGYSGAMDRDGDTEMSASPDARASRSTSRSTNMSVNPYGHLSNQEAVTARGESVSTEYSENRGPLSTSSRGGSVTTNGYGDDCEGEDLGVVNQMREVDEDSSDSSVRPPPRRLPRRYHQNPRVQQYDPRISMMFAEHQQSMRGTQNNPIGLDLNDWEGEIRRVESASRNRRMATYRNVPPRRVDPLRSSRSPSATRVISSSSRTARRPRQSLGGRVYN